MAPLPRLVSSTPLRAAAAATILSMALIATPAPAAHALELSAPASLPMWVKNTTAVTLLTLSSTTPVRTFTLEEGSRFQVLGQPENGRLPVYLDGSFTSGIPFGAWLDAANVAPADAPQPRSLVSSRGGSRSPNPDISTPSKFIAVVAEAAQDSQRETGVPASVTIAQAVLESSWGKSRLATKAFNFFGIKAKNGPGPAGVVNMDTWEVLRGSNVVVNDAFKAYNNVFESIDDHGRFLKENRRYSAAFQVSNDPREFARRIHAAGYATDPAYSTKLIGLMDRYNLYQYDRPAQ